MRILVTGGAGFIGSNVAAELVRRGHEVTVLDDLSTGYESNLHGLPVKLVRGDVRSRDDVEAAMKGQEGVCHLAASVGNKRSIEDPRFDASVNVQGTINVLEAMRVCDVRRIVYSSSAGIFGEPQREPVDESHPCEPLSPYGSTKLCAEKLCLAYMHLHGIRAVCLRYFNVFGEHQRYDAYGNVIPIFATLVLAGRPLTIYGDGEQTRDFVHVADVARANAMAIEVESARGPINVGTGCRTRIADLARLMRDLGGCAVDVIHAPDRPGDVRHCTADVRRLTSTLGFAPRTDLPGLLASYVEWFSSCGYVTRPAGGVDERPKNGGGQNE